MTVIRTATGKEYPCDILGVANGYALYAQVRMDMQEVLNIFQDENETKELSWINDQGDPVRTEYGFTVFGGFQIVEGNYPIRVRMTKKLAEI